MNPCTITFSSRFPKNKEDIILGIDININSNINCIIICILVVPIDKNIPIINLINPNNLITDGFYALYYYNTFNRYIRDICCLGVFIIVCLFISFRTLRREQYDYI